MADIRKPPITLWIGETRVHCDRGRRSGEDLRQVGLLVGTPEAATGAGLAWAFPLVWISNAFVPTNGMPAWLQRVAEWNPISAIVAATRDLFGNPNPAAHRSAFPLRHAVPVSIAWSVVLIVVFAPLAVAKYRRTTPS